MFGVNKESKTPAIGATSTNAIARMVLLVCVVGACSACAQSAHQLERQSMGNSLLDPGYAGAQSYAPWPGPGYGPGYGIGYGAGYWGHPFGYYGIPYGAYGPAGFGWYGGYGGFGGARPPSGVPGPRPTPPSHAPPQFRKKY